MEISFENIPVPQAARAGRHSTAFTSGIRELVAGGPALVMRPDPSADALTYRDAKKLRHYASVAARRVHGAGRTSARVLDDGRVAVWLLEEQA